MKTLKTFAFIFFASFLSLTVTGQDQTIKKAVGVWTGKLEIQGKTVELSFSVLANEYGQLTAKLDVPAQNAMGLPVSKVDAKKDSLIFYVDDIQGKFAGTFRNEKTVEGKWIQGDSRLPITLIKSENLQPLNRPQTPKKPYPYDEEEVIIENKKAGIKLSGALSYPKEEGKYPAIILISGSGAQDRDETIMGHKPFLVLSDFLTRRYNAVLRIDDRGVGKSTGKISESTLYDLAGDVIAAIEFLKKHPKINSSKIGLIGHSEGGLIAPIVANMSSDVKFVILMAGPGLVGEQIIYNQGELISRASGVPEDQIVQNLKLQKTLFSILKDTNNTANSEKRLFDAFVNIMGTPTDERQKTLFEGQIKAINTKWFKNFITYDPAPALEKVKCPILALFGEKDLQVSCKENLAAVEKAFKKGGNKKAWVYDLKGVNHLFQPCETGNISEYGQIEVTISMPVLTTIYDFVKVMTK